MTRTVLTGGGGFLGLHVRAALRERGDEVTTLAVGHAFDADAARRAVENSDLVIHLAGVNRGTDGEVRDGNALFAEQLASVLEQGTTARRVAYAGSVQSDVGGIYGQAKADAATRLTGAANRVGAEFHDLRLPNLFGEHGRPFYNAVTATFCHLLARGERPRVDVDRGLRLLHAQDAADLLVGTFPSSDLETLVQELSVVELLERLTAMAATYSTGDIPDVAQKVDRDLFNTYRSYVTELRPAVPLVRHSDARGSFFEIARTHGGPGQSSFSTTKPGIVRGEHFHRRKIERFTVLSGRAVISLRRLFGTEVVHVEVDGEHPLAVDMPTLWAHNIQNVGDELLYTSFWTDDIFDPTRPDTIAEVV